MTETDPVDDHEHEWLTSDLPASKGRRFCFICDVYEDEQPRDISSDPVDGTTFTEALATAIHESGNCGLVSEQSETHIGFDIIDTHDAQAASIAAALPDKWKRDISSDSVDGACHRPLGGNGEWCTTHDTDFPSGADRCNAPRDISSVTGSAVDALYDSLAPNEHGEINVDIDEHIAAIQREAVEPYRELLLLLRHNYVPANGNAAQLIDALLEGKTDA